MENHFHYSVRTLLVCLYANVQPFLSDVNSFEAWSTETDTLVPSSKSWIGLNWFHWFWFRFTDTVCCISVSLMNDPHAPMYQWVLNFLIHVREWRLWHYMYFIGHLITAVTKISSVTRTRQIFKSIQITIIGRSNDNKILGTSLVLITFSRRKPSIKKGRKIT